MCDKAFKTTSAVANHKAVHAQTKDFKCSQCSFTTSTKANLRVHDRTHSGVQPYKWYLMTYLHFATTMLYYFMLIYSPNSDHCPMRFSTASNMVKHMRNIHEKLKTNKVTALFTNVPTDLRLTLFFYILSVWRMRPFVLYT